MTKTDRGVSLNLVVDVPNRAVGGTTPVVVAFYRDRLAGDDPKPSYDDTPRLVTAYPAKRRRLP